MLCKCEKKSMLLVRSLSLRFMVWLVVSLVESRVCNDGEKAKSDDENDDDEREREYDGQRGI